MKDNLLAQKAVIGSVLKALRVVLFEKFSTVFFFFYLISVLSIAFILSILHWSIPALFFIISIFLFKIVLNNFGFVKRMLIRKNDLIEYIDPNIDDTSKMFVQAKIILKMKKKEAQKSNMISEDLMQGNKHFYLVQKDKKSTVIAYDWIISIYM